MYFPIISQIFPVLGLMLGLIPPLGNTEKENQKKERLIRKAKLHSSMTSSYSLDSSKAEDTA